MIVTKDATYRALTMRTNLSAISQLINQHITVGNAACLMQILVSAAIQTQPVTSGSTILLVLEFGRGWLNANVISAILLMAGLFGLGRVNTPLKMVLFSTPLLFYAFAVVSVTFSDRDHSYTGGIVWGCIGLILIAHAWEWARHD